MEELDLEAKPLIASLDICKVLERGLEDLNDYVDFYVDDSQLPSNFTPNTYKKIEEALKKEGIDIEELNKKINKAMFGEEGGIKYYPYKEVEEE